MGIRFQCPNGHQLHVKAFLAGKRGICPECDTKFMVPLESSGAVAVAEEAPAAGPEPTLASPVERPPAPLAPPPLPSATGQQQATHVWYVRAASGDQYGPATTEIMQGWAEEGRLQADSLVWQTGWPAWKTGPEALSLLSAPIAAHAVGPVDSVLTASSASKRHLSRQRSRRDRTRVIAFALGSLVLLLLIAVVLVVIRK